MVRLVYHLFVDEGLTLRRIAQRLAMLGQPTPSGGCQWQISTLHDWLRNPAAKGELYQLTHRAVAPKRRRKPTATTASHSPFSSAELRPREEWYLVPVPPAVEENTWATAQRRLDQNRALARRNGRRAYLLSGLVTCESCGRRMTGFYRAATGKRFYQCQHQPRVDGTGACRSPAVRAEPLEHAVWERMSELIRQPELLKGELARRSEAGSPTQDGLLLELRRARARLDAVPREMDRLVDGYGKNLIPDDRMRPRMEALKDEQGRLLHRVAELEGELARLQGQAALIEGVTVFAAKVGTGLDALDTDGQQKLLRLLVREVRVIKDVAVVRTVLPTGQGGDGQLCTPDRQLIQGLPTPSSTVSLPGIVTDWSGSTAALVAAAGLALVTLVALWWVRERLDARTALGLGIVLSLLIAPHDYSHDLLLLGVLAAAAGLIAGWSRTLAVAVIALNIASLIDAWLPARWDHLEALVMIVLAVALIWQVRPTAPLPPASPPRGPREIPGGHPRSGMDGIRQPSPPR